MVRFILNNETINTELPAGSTVLDYVRYHKRLHGTKIGCREGDCGACTILVGSFENDKLVYRSVTSCLMPLINAQGKHIVTVEGINMNGLSPVQQAMVDTNGTQCGFCTLGFIMSFTGFVMNHNTRSSEDAIAAIDGNICRCTGYKSIERAATVITEKNKDKPGDNTLAWLAKNGFIPVYFNTIEKRLKELQASAKASSNGTAAGLKIGGGTDLVVQKHLTVKRSSLEAMTEAKGLKHISVNGEECTIGASVTVTEFAESPAMQQMFPELKQYMKLVSSTPIRNMATLAGNFVNASPIGDMTVFFLALDSSVVLNDNGHTKAIKLKDLYKGYKQLDKTAEEFIEKIIFNKPALFNFEKVSKRTHLDIASVNSACQVKMNSKGVIESCHLSAGGVAPIPKYLSSTSAFLQGKTPTADVINNAISIMNEEIAPISDARGSSDYKRLLLRQLLLAHFLKFKGTTVDVKEVLKMQLR